jgi:glycosyltransferase involved in cell wall biosynthesis
MKSKPIFVLTVDSLAGPGHRWYKIINELNELEDFEFKFLTSKHFVKSISELNTIDSQYFINNNLSRCIVYDKYGIKFIDAFRYVLLLLYFRFKGYDTIHSIMSLSFSLRLNKILGFKINYEIVGPVFAEKILQSKNINNLNKLICVSYSIERKIKKHSNEDIHKKLYTYPIPYYKSNIDTNVFDEKKNIVVFAHNYMVKRKNYTLCAFLFADLAKEYPNWEFYFLGRGRNGEHSVKKYLKFIMHDYENIVFDYVNDISPILKQSKISLSFNTINNYPSQTIMESLNFGNSLLLTNTGDSHFFINNNGYLVEGNYSKVKEKLISMMNDDRLIYFCKNSQIHLKNNFDSSKVIDFLISIYK